MPGETNVNLNYFNQGRFLGPADATMQFARNMGIDLSEGYLASFFLSGAAAAPGQGSFFRPQGQTGYFAPTGGYNVNYGNMNSILSNNQPVNPTYNSIMSNNSNWINRFSYENSCVIMPQVNTNSSVNVGQKADGTQKKNEQAKAEKTTYTAEDFTYRIVNGSPKYKAPDGEEFDNPMDYAAKHRDSFSNAEAEKLQKWAASDPKVRNKLNREA